MDSQNNIGCNERAKFKFLSRFYNILILFTLDTPVLGPRLLWSMVNRDKALLIPAPISVSEERSWNIPSMAESTSDDETPSLNVSVTCNELLKIVAIFCHLTTGGAHQEMVPKIKQEPACTLPFAYRFNRGTR